MKVFVEIFNSNVSASVLNDFCGKASLNYLWNHETICFFQKDSTKSITSVTDVGESIDDEWFIVDILKRLSIEYPEIVLTVQDQDGDFLLIEGADYIPDWLSPDTSSNRVFISNGSLHLINPFDHPTLTLQQATRLVDDSTRASAELNQVAFKKPIQQSLHRTIALVPRQIACILFKNPQLIAYAVNCFYERDSAVKNSKFLPVDLVKTSVTMTRLHYATLALANYHTPKHYPICSMDDEMYSAAELGMKITMGFEYLFKKYSGNTEWIDHLQKLEKLDYFQGEIKGSFKYKKLYNEAFAQFTPLKYNPLVEIEDIITSKASEYETRPFQDDDSWIKVDQKDVEEIKETIESSDEADFDDVSDLDDQDLGQLQEMLTGFKEFVVQGESGVDGVTTDIAFNPDSFLATLKSILNVDPADEVFAQDDEMVKIMHEMDQELEQNTDLSHVLPCDTLIDTNLAENLLESFNAQQGNAGPTSNILGSIGLDLPH